MLDIEPFTGIFGPKSRRKRVKLESYNLEEIGQNKIENIDEK